MAPGSPVSRRLRGLATPRPGRARLGVATKTVPVLSLRTRLRNATRDAILSAAEDIIAERGMQTARMEDIAAAAGVSVGTIYNHFSDRQTLLEGLLDTRASEFVATARAVVDQTQGQPFEQRLHLFCQTMVGSFEAHRQLFALFVRQEVCHLEQGNFSWSPFAAIRDAADLLMKAGVASGEVEPENARVYTMLLLGMIRGLISASFFDELVALESLVPTLTRVFLRGVMLKGATKARRANKLAPAGARKRRHK